MARAVERGYKDETRQSIIAFDDDAAPLLAPLSPSFPPPFPSSLLSSPLLPSSPLISPLPLTHLLTIELISDI